MKCCVICLLIDLFRLCFVVCYVTLGSLSNHDGNGSQTVTQKVPNSRCYKLHRSYSNSFNLSNVGDFFRSWIYNPGQKSLGQCCNIHIFLSFLASLLKQYILFEIFLQFSLPLPIESWNTEKIWDTRVQHCLWGEGRGWTWMNWRTPHKCKSVPRLLSMIVEGCIKVHKKKKKIVVLCLSPP